EADNIRFERVHRIPLGPKSKYKFTRTLTAKFLWYQDRENVWKQRFKLKNHKGVFMSDSLPAEAERNRQILLPIFKKAKSLNRKCTLYADTLSLDGVRYKVRDLHKLPSDLLPLQSTVRTEGDISLYNDQVSPLGATHECVFNEKGVTYNSLAQYISASKAKYLDDPNAVDVIMMIKNQKMCHHMSNLTATPTKLNSWNKNLEDVLKKGNYLKFSQNPYLKAILKSTGTKTLGECNPHNELTGTGFKLSDKDAFNPNKWKGRNF
ncbi:unnamed protein product, partial [Owenia fusiformis]